MKQKMSHQRFSRIGQKGFFLLAVCGLLACGVQTAFAVTGDSKASAAAISVTATRQSKTYTLVADPEWASGVYYFKVSLKSGMGYTFWSTGSSSVSAYLGTWDSDFGTVNSDFFSNPTFDWLNFWMKVSPEDWWEEMVSGTYYLVVEGEVGESFTLNWTQGASDEPLPAGDSMNPKLITVGASAGSTPAALLGGEYYFHATLAAGKKYKFWSTGGTEANLGFLIDVEAVNADVESPVRTDVEDGDEYNDTIVVVPVASGDYLLKVTGVESAAFNLNYQVVPARLPAAHTTVITLGVPTIEGLESGPFNAGARNNPTSGFYDQVIDEQLFSASLEKDARYVFETFGEDAPSGLVMEIYDAKGTVLFTNRQKAPGETQTLIAFRAPSTATYWVGVCQDIEEPVGAVSCTLAVRKLTKDEAGQEDAWDTGDDALLGASGLAPVPGNAGGVGVGHGLHTLGLTDWADWFRIDARQGLSYELKAAVDNDMQGLVLKAVIYSVSGVQQTTVQVITNLMAGGTFTAPKNGSYSVCVSVADGQGVDYAYTLMSLAYTTAAGVQLGMLRVDIGGPTAADGGQWSLADGTKYPGGATVLLPAGAQTVKFNPVAGWTTPVDRAATVVAGTEPTVIVANYNDTSDPKDDSPMTATVLTPSNKSQKQSHSLWTTDVADWFKVTVKTDTYYTFTLEPYTGTPWLTVFSSNQTDVVAEGTDVRFLPEAAGPYYVRVDQTDPDHPVDSAYTLNTLAQTVGTIKIEKASYSIKEGPATADVKVLRSAKDGRVRVRYWTQQDTALPGTDYKPVKGYLEWKDGDGVAKTISVPLIPNLYQTWEANKNFSVLIETVPAGELEADELVPPLAVPTVSVVTIAESKTKAPGKLGFSGYGPDGEPISAFANVKSPVVAAGAGSEVTLWIARAGGADGEVSVKAETLPGTAVAGVNYESASEILVWGAGDLSPKPFTVVTLLGGDTFQATKTLTAKLTVDKVSGGGATLGTASVSVQVRDPSIMRTVEEWQTAGGNGTGGTLKPSVTGAWFFDQEGNLRCAPLAAKAKADLTVTFTGPGTLRFAAELVKGGDTDNSTFTYTVGGQTLACDSGEETVRYLPKGTQTVKFTVTRGTASPAEAEVFGRFADLSDQPFQWVPLSAPTIPVPSDKASLSPGGDVTFRWDAEHAEDFRIYVADSVVKLNNSKAMIAGYVAAHEFCTSCGDFESFVTNKTYYWRVDSVIPGENTADPAQDKLTNASAVWSFTVGAADMPITDGLVAGALADYVAPSGDGYLLVQGLAYKIGPFDAPNGETFKAANLPLGMGLTTVAGQVYITGIPTKTNAVIAVLQTSVKVGAKVVAGTTLPLLFQIVPAGLAAGTFNGLLTADSENANEALASLTFTATAAGALTAKVLVAGKTYPFTGTGFSEDVPDLKDGQPGLRAVLTFKSVVAGVTYTNTLKVTACRGAATDISAIDTPVAADLSLWIAATDAQSAREVLFTGLLVRDNSKVALVSEGLKSGAGYYTVSLPVRETVDGAPAGAGYVTFTLDVAGSAKLSGVLADGTVWTASGVPGYVFNYNESGVPALLVPVYTAKAKMAMGGWIVINADPLSGLAVASGQIDWYNADPNATRGGTEGFSLALDPTGGFYDKLFNLQTYYLNAELNVGAIQAPDALDATYTERLCMPDTYGVSLIAVGNSLTVGKRILVKDAGNSALYDFQESSNPCNLSLVFVQATGLYSGTFSLWYGNAAGTLQREQAGLKFQGVLTPAKQSVGAYTGSPGLGFYQIPEKVALRTWTGSYLFTINAEEILQDWSEGWDN